MRFDWDPATPAEHLDRALAQLASASLELILTGDRAALLLAHDAKDLAVKVKALRLATPALCEQCKTTPIGVEGAGK